MYDFKSFNFGHGSHQTREEGMCVMEAVAYVSGEEHSDHPRCACPVISKFLRSWNDGLPSDSERNRLLAQFVWRMPGTRATEVIEDQRQWMCLDWLIRVNLPTWLDQSPSLVHHAASLRGADPIVDMESLAAIRPMLDAAWDAEAVAAWDVAAWDAARAAAARAAGGATAAVAAWDAARAAAAARARSAWDAVVVAGGAAARAAGGATAAGVIRPTVAKLQRSAVDLVDRMIRLTEIQEPEIVPEGVAVA